MAQLKTFKDLKVWQKAHQLTLATYKITQQFPLVERFGLTSQTRRAVISVSSNIVEGFKRKSIKDSLYFYNIAESSLEEVKYQLLIARDLKYISNKEYCKIISISEEVGKILYGWIRSQKMQLNP